MRCVKGAVALLVVATAAICVGVLLWPGGADAEAEAKDPATTNREDNDSTARRDPAAMPGALPTLEVNPLNPGGSAPAPESNAEPNANAAPAAPAAPTTTATAVLPTIKASLEVGGSDNAVEHEYEDLDVVVAATTNYTSLKVVAHDATAFTQGLYYDKDQGRLIESTGLYGQSLVRIWDPQSGAVHSETPTLDSQYFGEGLTHFQDADGSDKYIQITWKKRTAFVYDTDLNLLDTRTFDTSTGEGWGITFDPVEGVFYVSDGSANLHVWDLDLREIRNRRRAVAWTDATGRSPVRRLNELEWDPTDGTILANVWMDTNIVRIWPANGNVVRVYEMGELASGGGDVLNGIAHHSGKQWWITGKQWRNLHLLEFLD